MPTISPEEIFPGKLTGNYWGPGKLLYDSCQYGKSNLFTCVRCVLSKKHNAHIFSTFFPYFSRGGGGDIRREILRFASKYVMASQHRIDEIIFGLFILATKKEGESRWPELDT